MRILYLQGRRDKFNFTNCHKRSPCYKTQESLASRNTFAPLSTSPSTLWLVEVGKIQEKKVSSRRIDDERRCHVRELRHFTRAQRHVSFFETTKRFEVFCI